MTEPVAKRARKSAHYTPGELNTLYNLYRDNYDQYHAKFEGGSRTSEQKSKDRLSEEWAALLSSKGVEKRDAGKIREKLKKDLYNARAVLTSFKAATRGTGGGKAPEEPRKSHPHFAPLFDILETTVAVKGIINSETAFLEYDAQLTQEDTKQKEMKIEEEAKVKGFDCEDAKISVLDLKPSITTPKMAPRKLLNSFTRSNTTKRAHKLVENVNEERTRLLRLEQESAMLKNQKLRLECMLLKKQLLRVDLEFQEKYGYIPVVAGETTLLDTRDTNDGMDINFTEKINTDINKYEEQDEDVEDEFIEVEED